MIQMRLKDFDTLYVVGVLVAVLGVFSYFYEERYFYGVLARYPYRSYSGILILMGLFVIAVSFVIKGNLRIRAESRVETERSIPREVEKSFCRYCGAENNSDAVFCEKCGKELST